MLITTAPPSRSPPSSTGASRCSPSRRRDAKPRPVEDVDQSAPDKTRTGARRSRRCAGRACRRCAQPAPLPERCGHSPTGDLGIEARDNEYWAIDESQRAEYETVGDIEPFLESVALEGSSRRPATGNHRTLSAMISALVRRPASNSRQRKTTPWLTGLSGRRAVNATTITMRTKRAVTDERGDVLSGTRYRSRRGDIADIAAELDVWVVEARPSRTARE